MNRFYALALLVLALFPATSEGGQKLIAPPFVRKWTHLFPEDAHVIGVRTGLIYYSSNDRIGALSLKSGETEWESRSHISIISSALQDDAVFAITQGDRSCSLEAIDLSTRGARMLARLSNSSHCLCVLRDRAYVLDEYGKLQAFDLSSGRRIWTIQLGPVPKESFGSGYLVATPAGLYASVDRSGEFGAKIEDGKVLWTRQFEHQTVYPPVAIGNDVITSQSGLKRIRIRTGDAVWSAASEYWSFLVADVVISDGRQGMTGRNASTGEILWRHPTPDPALSTVRYAYTPDADPDSIWLDGEVKFCFK